MQSSSFSLSVEYASLLGKARWVGRWMEHKKKTNEVTLGTCKKWLQLDQIPLGNCFIDIIDVIGDSAWHRPQGWAGRHLHWSGLRDHHMKCGPPMASHGVWKRDQLLESMLLNKNTVNVQIQNLLTLWIMLNTRYSMRKQKVLMYWPSPIPCKNI